MEEQEDEDEASQSISLTQPTANRRMTRGGGDDEGAESVSVTPPTVSQRPSPRQFAKPLVREEDSAIDTESGLGREEHTGSSPDYAQDGEDDESTAGYDSAPEVPERRGGKGLLLAALAVLVLVVLGALAFLMLGTSPSQPTDDFGPPPAQPMRDPSAPAAPSAEAPPTPAEAAPGAVAEAPAAAEPGTPPANPIGEPAAAPGDTAPGATPPPAVAGADTNPAATALVAPQPAAPSVPPIEEPAKPTGVQVKFKTSSTTATIWVNGRKVEPNKLLKMPAGTIRVRFQCSTHKRPNKGSFVQTLREGMDKPKEFSIPCRKGQR